MAGSNDNTTNNKFVDKEDWTCTVCDHQAQTDAIKCRACKHWVHYACAQMGAIYLMLLSDTNLMFLCLPCIHSRLSKKILNNDVAEGLKKINCAIERHNLFLKGIGAKRKSVASCSSINSTLRPSSIGDSAPSVPPTGGVRSTRISDDSIDEGPEEIVIQAMIHDPDRDILTSQEVNGVKPTEGTLSSKLCKETVQNATSGSSGEGESVFREAGGSIADCSPKGKSNMASAPARDLGRGVPLSQKNGIVTTDRTDRGKAKFLE